MFTNVTIEEAREMFLGLIIPLQPERIPLVDSLQRITATDIAAPGDLPPCCQSAVDGFVIHNSNLKGNCELLIEDNLGPGEIPARILNPGQTVKVTTGGTLPAGSAAVMFEEAGIYRGNYLFVKETFTSGTNIKQQGEDIKKGDLIVRRNTSLNPGALGVLAAYGQPKVTVYRRPSAAIICLGPEVIPYQLTPKKGQVRDSNGPLLAALIHQDGGQVTDLAYVAHSTGNSIIDTLERLFKKADLVITVGGASSGEYDRAFSLLREAGVKMVFWGMQIKPGSHSGGGFRESKPVLALAGNPAACVVGYHLLVTPVLRQMQGLPPGQEKVMAVSIDNYHKSGGVRRFLRGQLFFAEGSWKVSISPGQKSSMLRSLLSYNSLIDLRSGHPPLEEGAVVPVIPVMNYDFK
jgi:molybdopterin molybdotransferase